MAKANKSPKQAAKAKAAVKAALVDAAKAVKPVATSGNGKSAKPEVAKPVQLPMPVLCKACQKQMGSDWEIKPIVNPERSDAAKRAWVTIRANREKAAADAAAEAAAMAKAVKRGKPAAKLVKSKKA